MSELSPARVTALELENFLHEKIPLTRAMGLRVAHIEADKLVLEAPLEPNHNHLGTAFGGSLQMLSTVACYSVAWILLKEAGLDGHVVIKQGEINYHRPVTHTLRAVCQFPSTDVSSGFLAAFRRYKKSRLNLTATVIDENGKSAVEFRGSFVALV